MAEGLDSVRAAFAVGALALKMVHVAFTAWRSLDEIRANSRIITGAGIPPGHYSDYNPVMLAVCAALFLLW